MKTKVIFRTFPEGDVIALFPLVPADNQGWNCQSYQRIGQHGAADPHIVHSTRPSTPKEIHGLACELRRLGYKLTRLKRFPRNAFAARKAEMKGSQ